MIFELCTNSTFLISIVKVLDTSGSMKYPLRALLRSLPCNPTGTLTLPTTGTRVIQERPTAQENLSLRMLPMLV